MKGAGVSFAQGLQPSLEISNFHQHLLSAGRYVGPCARNANTRMEAGWALRELLTLSRLERNLPYLFWTYFPRVCAYYA